MPAVERHHEAPVPETPWKALWPGVSGSLYLSNALRKHEVILAMILWLSSQKKQQQQYCNE